MTTVGEERLGFWSGVAVVYGMSGLIALLLGILLGL